MVFGFSAVFVPLHLVFCQKLHYLSRCWPWQDYIIMLPYPCQCKENTVNRLFVDWKGQQLIIFAGLIFVLDMGAKIANIGNFYSCFHWNFAASLVRRVGVVVELVSFSSHPPPENCGKKIMPKQPAFPCHLHAVNCKHLKASNRMIVLHAILMHLPCWKIITNKDIPKGYPSLALHHDEGILF